MTIDAKTVIVEKQFAGTRLDQFLASLYSEYSRTYFAGLIEDSRVLIDGVLSKKKDKVFEGDEIEVIFPKPIASSLEPEDIPLDILYEDEHLIVVNKPQGMLVHPGAGNPSGTVANALLYYLGQFSSDPVRPGIVHRLDKDTSGALLVAKNDIVHRALVEQFALRNIQKTYLAITLGAPSDGIIDEPIARDPVHRTRMCVDKERGKAALSRTTLLAKNEKLALVAIDLITGRTHQIRVHLQHKKTPILGDMIYGSCSANKNYGIEKQLLHASKLSFNHPITKIPLHFHANPPQMLQNIVNQHFPEKISWLLSVK